MITTSSVIKRPLKHDERELQRTEMHFPSSSVCNTSVRLLSDSRVMCIGPYRHGVSVGVYIYINDHSESVGHENEMKGKGLAMRHAIHTW